ncbi:kinase-like domain-containing protein [Penicillium fimorum]|uniref:EKC/KEOPS complex subunit BUD32 n=1 Tax=Penicillium fimorum TaxID=1882269 RepID=A0A9X0C6I9_9EURO|nr:kinase-like domain-containing protein [Penicillium fimorum]
MSFRFEWLQQLTEVVGFLHLELGIMHQDVAPWNLLVDPGTHKILLFDFDWAVSGKERLVDNRDDLTGVVFTLYQLITTTQASPAGIEIWTWCRASQSGLATGN